MKKQQNTWNIYRSSIEPKAKAGKQGGHVVVVVDSSKSVSTDILVKVMHKFNLQFFS